MVSFSSGCDLLKNSYLCLLNNTELKKNVNHRCVVICWKIRIFAYWTTPLGKQRCCLFQLWFAEKFVSLLIEQHQNPVVYPDVHGCDLLKNSYLCLLNNTNRITCSFKYCVVICWKIRIFAYWTTPELVERLPTHPLWFAEKFVSLLIEQHRIGMSKHRPLSCDLLKNSYLCLLNNTAMVRIRGNAELWFAEKFVSLLIEQHLHVAVSRERFSCDLLKNSYLCLLNNTTAYNNNRSRQVVICWKIRIFAYWTTPRRKGQNTCVALWFAEKFVSLLIEQHQQNIKRMVEERCDLLKNSYLCLLNNTTEETEETKETGCDLLKNSYLCLLNNTS